MVVFVSYEEVMKRSGALVEAAFNHLPRVIEKFMQLRKKLPKKLTKSVEMNLLRVEPPSSPIGSRGSSRSKNSSKGMNRTCVSSSSEIE